VSNLLKSTNGKTSRKKLIEFKALNRQFWRRHLWARGYFETTSTSVTEEVVMQYIEQQGKAPIDGDFKVDGEDL
jgi:putative transposase